MVSLEMAQIVPPHSVDVSLPNLVRQLNMVLCHELIQRLVTQEPGLLDDLGIRPGDPDSLDSSDKEVSDSLNRLDPINISVCYFSSHRDSTNFMCKTLQLRLNVMSSLDLEGIQGCNSANLLVYLLQTAHPVVVYISIHYPHNDTRR